MKRIPAVPRLTDTVVVVGRRSFLRRGLSTVAGIALASCATPDSAAKRAAPPLVGYLGVNFPTDPDNVRNAEDFRKGLREEGLVEGQNLSIEWRYAEGRGQSWAKGQTTDLVDRGVRVMVTGGSLWEPVRETTDRVPIVMAGNAERLIALGWATSLAAPGGNVTGLSFLGGAKTYSKRLEVLLRVAPRIRRLAVMSNLGVVAVSENDLRTTPASFGLSSLLLDVRTQADVEHGFARAREWAADGLCVEGVTPTSLLSSPIAKLAAQFRFPTIYSSRSFVEAGGLMSYGAVFPEGYLGRRPAWYVARILEGADPGTLPIELPTGVIFLINRAALANLGLALSPEVALQVTEWID